jgi:hypothetical protein
MVEMCLGCSLVPFGPMCEDKQFLLAFKVHLDLLESTRSWVQCSISCTNSSPQNKRNLHVTGIYVLHLCRTFSTANTI